MRTAFKSVLLQGLVLFSTLLGSCYNSAASGTAAPGSVAPPSGSDPIIGIDLGTTYSCVGIMKSGNVEIIPNDFGERTTPSWVAFSGKERLIGQAAKLQASRNSTNTFYAFKRFMGMKCTSPGVQDDIKRVQYKVDCKYKDNIPHAVAVVNGVQKWLRPEELSAMVLTKMKEIAESHLNKPVKYAVITVPAYFDDAQRQATKDAGAIAGLEVLRLVNEPTAAAMAYGFGTGSHIDKEQKILVFDLGGGTFDVSLLTVENGIFEVKSVNGDTHLGGEDFDAKLIDYMADIIKKKHSIDVRTSPKAMSKLRDEAEKTKRQLSNVFSVTIEVEYLTPELEYFSETISRAKFEELNRTLFEKTINPVKKVLEDAGVGKKEVDEIILVGGSTRIPKIRQLLEEFFDGKKALVGINPDEAVAYGAAVQASILRGDEETKDMVLLDVTPLTLGIETQGGVMSSIIPRNTGIPTKKSQMFSTAADNQDTVTIRVLQGERSMAADNQLLGQFDLSGIRPERRGVPQIEVTFTIDANGILTISAVDKGTGNSQSLQINSDKSRLQQEEIERMVAEAEKYKAEDDKRRQLATKKNEFDALVYDLEIKMKDEKVLEKIPDSDKTEIQEAVQAAKRFADTSKGTATVDDYEREAQKLQPYAAKVYAATSGSGAEGPGSAGHAEEAAPPVHDDL